MKNFEKGNPSIVIHKYKDPITGQEVMEEFEHYYCKETGLINKDPTGRFLTHIGWKTYEGYDDNIVKITFKSKA